MKTGYKALILAGLVSAVGIAAASGVGLADSRDGERRMDGHQEYGRNFQRGPGRGARLLETFDSNGDGRLTQAEIDAVRAERFAAFDADGNGELTLQEYQALWLDAMRERMVDRFQNLDDDGDAVVTTGEFLDPFAALVQHMDRNGDDVLSPDDMGRRDREDDGEDDR